MAPVFLPLCAGTYRCVRMVLPGLLWALLILPARADDGWSALVGLRFADAGSAFSSDTTGTRDLRLGRALALLGRQPRTRDHIESAKRELEGLIADNATDRVGLVARLALGRVLDRHVDPPRTDEAIGVYRRLVTEAAGDPVAESAAAGLVMMSLYRTMPPEERLRDLEDLELIGAKLKTPAGRRDFHLAMAAACVDFRTDPERALRHYLAADALGIARAQNEAEAWVAIIELAATLGHPDVVRSYAPRYLAKFPRSTKRTLVEERLQAAAAEGTP